MLDDDKTQTILDSMSPSICAAKWYNATIWLGSGMTTSCHHPLPHKIDIEAIKTNPSAIHNTPEKKEQRREMQNGVRPSGCEYCWKLEDHGQKSDRVYKSNIYTEDDLRAIGTMPIETDVNLKTLEIAFDRTCNLACSYCNPSFSTTWAKDINTRGPYANLNSDGRNHYTHSHNSSQLFKFNETNPYVEAFFKWWETDLHKTLDELRITGGEPLMSGDLWRLLDWYQVNPQQSKTKLAINTNLCAKDDLIDKLIAVSHNIESLDIYTSIEAVGSRAEYIRDGLDFQQWERNMHRLVDEAKINGLHIMATPSVLSIMNITEFLDWCKDFKKKFNIVFSLNIMRFPSFQSITVLPSDMKQTAADRLEEWLNGDMTDISEFEQDHVRRLAKYLVNVDEAHAGVSSRDKLVSDLRSFLSQYDGRRDKSLANSAPEIEGWLRE